MAIPSTLMTVRLILCPPVDPSGRAQSAPFEVDMAESFALLMVEPALPIPGAGTTALPLGPVPAPGIKGFVLMLDPSSPTASISVTWTHAVTGTGGVQEISALPGAPGVVFIFNANPVNGIASISIVHSGSVLLRALAFA